MSEPRILVYDLETSPNVGYTWGKWQQNVIRFQQDWFILSVAWKWRGESRTYVMGLDDYEGYVPGDRDDSSLAWLLHDLFDEADVTITHNGVGFDQPKARTRMAVHNLPPHSPFKEIDTLKVARKVFAFTSNRLEDLCRQLGLEHKGKVTFDCWLGCMAGDGAAWRKMKKYNRQDVIILEQLYERLLPWMDGHPNLALMSPDKPDACPKCLGGPLKSGGWRYYHVTKRHIWRCKECGGISYGRSLIKSDVSHVT